SAPPPTSGETREKSNRHSLPLIATEGSLGGERTLPTVAIAEGARPRIRAHRGWGWAGNRWGGLCRAGPRACSCSHLSILGGLRLPVLRLRLWLSLLWLPLLWLPLRLLLVSRLGSGTACRGGSDCASRNRPQCGCLSASSLCEACELPASHALRPQRLCPHPDTVTPVLRSVAAW